VLGVNHGKTFTANPCLARQWQLAGPPLGLYLNSGFSAGNAGRTAADCGLLGKQLAAADGYRRAYAIGCTEATSSLGAIVAAGIGRPATWWIDVETANSWDEHDLNLNRFALQGEIDQLAARGHVVGLYSSFDDWRTIAGDWSPAGIAADWVAGQPPAASCAHTGFSRHPVWLAQEAATWPGSGYDSDWAC
jgi:hypothetical protein